ncbi:MAG TPA: NAD-dependent epimerase/dehydratase family protein [Candidatus Baltobacteraceae bacterium]|jgi:UDP-glucose 4-epimerase|nr:NAD-dependent epimerase/dehydratase family protein [Candidatus Baltobacteraceae bacterium]
MKTLTITGYPGWLTTALLDDYKSGSAEFDRLVVLAHPSAESAAKDALAAYSWPSSVVAFDLANPDGIADRLRGCDVLIHTAAVIHVRKTADWYRVNAKGTIELAKAAKAAGVKRFVFVSSIAAAGKSPANSDLVESDAPHPMHHYGRSKLIAERALLAMHEPGVFEVVILRPSMFYGPPVPPRHVEIYKRILHGRMPLIGGGNYRRSLVHVDNLVQAVRLAATVPQAAGQTYFIVDRPVYTTYSVVEAMAEALGVKARYVRLPAVLAETAYQLDRGLSALGLYVAPVHLVGESHWHQSASCEKAIAELGYAPNVELQQGMRGAIAWCRERGLI